MLPCRLGRGEVLHNSIQRGARACWGDRSHMTPAKPSDLSTGFLWPIEPMLLLSRASDP